MNHAFFKGLRAPLHISHRGGALVSPENTMFAFERAVREFHTDVIELDVHATRDGEIVVAHDSTVDRCTDGLGPIAKLRWAEVMKLDAGFRFTSVTGESFKGRGIRIPRFVEVLRAFPTLRFNVELKETSVLEPFVAMAREEKCLERLCIGSERDELGRTLTERLPDALHFYPRNALAAFVLPIRGGDEPEDDGRYTVLDMPLTYAEVTLFDELLAKEAAKRHKWINVWTVDDPADMRRVIGEGVGGIMTDRPDLLREVLGDRLLSPPVPAAPRRMS